MDSRTMAIAIAAASGATMALQGSINASLSKFVGLLEATFVVHAVGLALVSALLFGLGLQGKGLGEIARAPWYTWLGGVMGVGIIYGVANSIPKVGAAPATTAIIASQVIAASLVDHFGLFGLDKMPWCPVKTLGVALLIIGSWFVLRR